MINLKYIGPINDSSGYATAARENIRALLSTKRVNLSVGTTSFEQQKTTHGKADEEIFPYINKDIPYKIQVIHLTPENYSTYRKKGLYNIAYTPWETDRLPESWIPLCNSMDEIWVPSDWNIEVYRRSGVTKPMFKVPHVIEIPDLSDINEVKIGSTDTFVFYSIFQWIERKGPISLLRAYLTEFKPEENVTLALKTYRMDTSIKEQQIVKSDINNIKKSLRIEKFPSITFFGNLMPYEYIKGLHQRGDCFVLPHKGEGFGIPIAEAMAFGNPVISTNYSGNLEFMNQDNSYLIDYCEGPVSGMIFSNYNGYMNWAEPSVGHLKSLMRRVYERRNEAREKGLLGKKVIQENYSSQAIGNLIVDRLEDIQKLVG